MYVRTLTWIGNGVAGKQITGAGFAPILALVKGGSNVGVWRSSAMSGDSTAFLTSATANFAGGITSLDSNGITLGADATVNALGTQYYCLLLGDDGSGDIAVGSYLGTGLAHAVSVAATLTGTPNMAWVKADGAQVAYLRTTDTANALPFSAAASITNRITALGSGTFTVGNNAATNGSGTTYYYLALKNTTGKFGIFTYVGNAVDDRDVTLPVSPNAIIEKGDTAQAPPFRTGDFDGDSCAVLGNTAATTNRIQAFGISKMTIGTDATVNSNAVNYYGLAFKNFPVAGPNLLGSPLVEGNLVGGRMVA